MSEIVTSHLDELRDLVAEILELEPSELSDDSDFVEVHGADSLRAIEILARIEKRYEVEIPQSELPNMGNLRAVYTVVAQRAGW